LIDKLALGFSAKVARRLGEVMGLSYAQAGLTTRQATAMQPMNPTSLPPYTGTLTHEHLAVVRAERDRWLRVGLSTTPADRPAAEAAVRVAYAAAGLRPPGIVVWMDSPLAGCLAVVTHPQLHGQLHGPLDRDQLWHPLKDHLERVFPYEQRGQPGSERRRRLYDELAGPIGGLAGPLTGQLKEDLRDQLGPRLQTRLLDQLGDQFWHVGQLYDQLGDPLTHQLWGELRVRLGAQLHDQLGSRLSGHDPWWQPYWLATYRCALRIAGLEPSPRLDALADAVARLGDWWPLRGAVVLTDRPTILARDAQGRLHAEAGPALAWADGFAVHAIHGVRVPAPVVEAPETITVGHIHDEPDVEVRRVMLERYGHARFLRDAGAEQVHADDTGTLWRCPISDDEPLVMVQVTNATPEPDGTRLAYWLRVPPGMRTARQAVAWTFNLNESDYHPTAQT
jgi:hypothetical protein